MLNRLSIMGRVVAKPELRTTPQGVSVSTFTIAVNRSYVSKGSERETDFFEVVVWRNTAEFVCKYFDKGMLIALDGRIQTRKYEDRDGKNRTKVEILAENVFFCESKKTADAPTPAPAANDGFQPIEFSDDDDIPF